ncbi:hypothetical protein, partial [Azospirillum brasilense]|uniref:hypothetical protein n=1 Tax=Azospirillum brasilense TaxID=192 RepID=UPI003D7C7F04
MAVSIISGSEILVNTTVTSDQHQPSVTVLANGTQLVTWASNGQDGSGYGVYARLLDGHGQPLGDEFRVNASTDKSQSNPKVTGLGNGGFMVVWDEVDAVSQPDIRNSGVYARFYDAAGNAVGSEWKLAVSYAAYSEAAQLADGSAVMVWLQNGTVWGQRFAANGTPLTGIFSLGISNGASLNVTGLAGGGYAVSWTDTISQPGYYVDVYTQVFSASNTAVGSVSRVSTYGNYNQSQNMVAALADGGYVVVSMCEGGLDLSGNGIFARRYDALGRPLGGETRVNNFVAGDQQQPSVTALADGGYVIAWTSAAQDGSGYGVYAQRYDAAGNKLGGDFLLAQNIAGNQVQPVLAARADGGFVAVWAGQDGSGYGIQIREFTPSEAAPVFTAQSVGVQAGESLLAATLIHPGHAQGESWATSGLQRIIQYEFIDTNASAASGHFELNGVVQASGQTIAVTADQLGTLRFVGGSAAASDAILVRVSDGVRWSDWDIATTQTFAPATSFVSGQERAVNPTVVNDQLLPSVTVLANGTQVVTWASNGQDGSGYGVYAR